MQENMFKKGQLLWRHYTQIRQEMKEANICRGNLPVEAEFTEYLVCRLFRLKRAQEKTQKGWDAKKHGKHYQIKSFCKEETNENGINLKRIRGYKGKDKVHYLIVVVYDDESFGIKKILRFDLGNPLIQHQGSFDPRSKKWDDYNQLKKVKHKINSELLHNKKHH